MSLPKVKIYLDNVGLSALLDSGSGRSFINKQMADNLNLKLRHCDIRCFNASSVPMSVLGYVRCKIKIDKYSWQYDFLVVPNLLCPLILGVDFMTHVGMLIDFALRKFHFAFDHDKISFTNESSIVESSPICYTDFLSFFEDNDRITPDLSHLNAQQGDCVNDIIKEFPDVLTVKLGLTSILEYNIVLTDHTPVHMQPYRLAPPRMEILKEHVNKMMEQGIIRLSTSNYSNPIFLVLKGENEFRPVVDYRCLNKKIHVESVPLPNIHSCFHWFKNARYFTSLDLNSAYHQIPLSENSRKYTAFATDWNLYEFCRLPFGISVGAQVLTRLLDMIFSDIKFQFVFHYLDDLVIYSNSFEEHMLHLREVFSRLRNANLTINPSKVVFASSKLSFLGHIVSSEGIQIDPERTASVLQFPPPKDAKGIARFIGMANFFNKFIPNFADIAAPLNILRKKGIKFIWGQEQETAFQKIKKIISSPPVLATADFSRRFLLRTDASGSAVGCVLLQKFTEGLKPIAYASRTLSVQERKYSIYEALAVLFALDKFRMYLEHNEFDLETDNQALSWVLARPRKSGRLARWAVQISQFKFVPRHIRSSQNVVVIFQVSSRILKNTSLKIHY